MKTCSVDGCGRPHFGRGLCHAHHSRMWRTGNLRPCILVGASFSGPLGNAWKGGISKTKDGRVLVFKPGHPNAYRNGYVLRARLVASEKLGRPLNPTEDVHHENGVKHDDSTDNVSVMSHAEHSRHHNSLWAKPRKPRLMDGRLPAYERATKVMALSGSMTQKEIAAKFGIHQSTVSLILNRKIWKR